MSGVLMGGWEYVWAAYGITGTVLIVYTLSLLVRVRRARDPGAPADPEV